MFGRLKSLLLSCPHCGYKQEESQVARSTFCRKRECGAHYRIEDGQPVPETPPAAYPFPLRDQLGDKPEGSKAARESRPRKGSEQLPRQKQLELFQERCLETADAPKVPPVPPSLRPPAPPKTTRRLPALRDFFRRCPGRANATSTASSAAFPRASRSKPAPRCACAVAPRFHSKTMSSTPCATGASVPVEMSTSTPVVD